MTPPPAAQPATPGAPGTPGPGLEGPGPSVARPAPTAAAQRHALVIAGFGQSLLLTFVSTFILVYLTDQARLSASSLAAASGVIFAARIFDAFSDPVMGSIVDKTHSRWGKMRPYVLFSALPVAALTWLMFSIPDLSDSGKVWFFAIVYFAWGIAYTMCDVPFWGLIGAAFDDAGERTRAIGHVRGVQSVATGLATLTGLWLAIALSFSSDGAASGAGWSRAAGVIAVTGMALYLRAFFGTRERRRAATGAVTLKVLFGTLAKNTPLLLVLAGSVLGFGRLIIQAGGAVFAVIAWDNPGYFTVIGGAIIVGLIISAFGAPRLIARWGSKQIVLFSSVAGAAINLVMFAAGFSSLWLTAALIFLNGLTLGLFLVGQTTMIADAVDNVEARTGVRNDGISFSTLTFTAKVMAALSAVVFGLVVAASGYQKGVQVTPAMQQAAWIAITLIPAASCLLSAIPFAFYRLPGLPAAPGAAEGR